MRRHTMQAAVVQVSVSETLLWRTVTLVRRLDLGRLSGAAAADSVTRSASTDVPIQVLASLALPCTLFAPMQSRKTCPLCSLCTTP